MLGPADPDYTRSSLIVGLGKFSQDREEDTALLSFHWTDIVKKQDKVHIGSDRLEQDEVF